MAGAIAASFAASCMLLEPYPGGGDPLDVFGDPGAGVSGGDPQDPLVDPPTDEDVSVANLIDQDCPDDPKKDCVVALPGTGFPVRLQFIADAANVVGGGIRIKGSQEVQWTLLADVAGKTTGELSFAYVLPSDACDGLPNLCHVIETEQFAVVTTSDGFAVSEAIEVNVVLQCATCSSQSCVDALPPGACKTCTQPDVCDQLGQVCFSPGAPGDGTEAATIFDAFLDDDGVLWSSDQGCAQGETVCQAALDEFNQSMTCTF